jgi:hypothetical protein
MITKRKKLCNCRKITNYQKVKNDKSKVVYPVSMEFRKEQYAVG